MAALTDSGVCAYVNVCVLLYCWNLKPFKDENVPRGQTGIASLLLASDLRPHTCLDLNRLMVQKETFFIFKKCVRVHEHEHERVRVRVHVRVCLSARLVSGV